MTIVLTKCSGQNLVNPRDHDMCPTAPEVPREGNTPKIPSGSYATLRRESRTQPRDTSQLWGEDPESLLIPTSVTNRLYHRLLLNSVQQGFRIALTVASATKSPHFKYPHIPSGIVIDSDGYLGMSIPTIKHRNLNGYGRILTADLNHGERSTPSVTPNSLLIYQHSPTRRGRRKERRTLVMRKSFCNTEKR